MGRRKREGGREEVGKEGREGGRRKEGKGLLHIRAHVFREILNGAQERKWGSQVALRLKAKPALSPS